MPNGISCAVFAFRNAKAGKENKDIFRTGVAGIQTCRTVDAALTSTAQLPFASTSIGTKITTAFGKVANFGKKLLYPLIFASSAWNTIKSKDKTKTGLSCLGGISTMYTFEKCVESPLKKVNAKISQLNNTKPNIALKILWYITQGAIYSATSIIGYDIGYKGAGEIIDMTREKAKTKNQTKAEKEKEKEKTSSEEKEEQINLYQNENPAIFSEIA